MTSLRFLLEVFWIILKHPCALVWSLSCVPLFVTLWIVACQASLSFTISPRVCSNSCPLSQQCHSTILSFVASFSSCPQSFPETGSFPMSQLFASGGQSTECPQSVHASSVHSINDIYNNEIMRSSRYNWSNQL